MPALCCCCFFPCSHKIILSVKCQHCAFPCSHKIILSLKGQHCVFVGVSFPCSHKIILSTECQCCVHMAFFFSWHSVSEVILVLSVSTMWFCFLSAWWSNTNTKCQCCVYVAFFPLTQWGDFSTKCQCYVVFFSCTMKWYKYSVPVHVSFSPGDNEMILVKSVSTVWCFFPETEVILVQSVSAMFFVVCFLVHDGVIQVLASACITFPWRQWNDFSEKCQHCVVFFSWDSEVILVQNVSTVWGFFQCMMKWYKYNMPVLCAYSIFFLETNDFSTKRQHYVVCF